MSIYGTHNPNKSLKVLDSLKAHRQHRVINYTPNYIDQLQTPFT